ncbi:hypothetical protein [Candidatus Igneacidithiobacillus taiwanensis]|uniref:hypothetical protein n=1 Tax=Candidatus Igneacidithiobacillus taiwanensis TaxID=1945924 RepID=UPI00289D1E0C|nr:hypothetical protein [Candidatus Igneacidithiobacillus taiwanensis]
MNDDNTFLNLTNVDIVYPGYDGKSSSTSAPSGGNCYKSKEKSWTRKQIAQYIDDRFSELHSLLMLAVRFLLCLYQRLQTSCLVQFTEKNPHKIN